jgi:hypothetical protein
MSFWREQEKEAAAVKMKPLIIPFSAVILTAFLLAVPGRIAAGDKYQEMINCKAPAPRTWQNPQLR